MLGTTTLKIDILHSNLNFRSKELYKTPQDSSRHMCTGPASYHIKNKIKRKKKNILTIIIKKHL